MPYKNILLSLAFKEEEDTVIREAIRLKTNLDAQLAVFHINDPGAGKAHMMMDGLPLVTEEDIRSRFRKLGYKKEADEIDVIVKEGESYPSEIAAATNDADLLVIGHKKKNSFLAFLIDSTDERVSDLVSCPVLVVPM